MKMTRTLGTVLLLAMSLLSCTPKQQTASNPQAVKACLMQCQSKLQHCNQTCSLCCANCQKKSFGRAAERHQKYVHEQRIAGGFVARQAPAYRDPLQCRKTTCNCQADLQVCQQGCGGKIHKQLRAVRVCC